MHENRVARSHFHQIGIDLIGRKILHPRTFLITHRNPHIRDQRLAVSCCLNRVIMQGDVTALRPGPGQQLSRWRIAIRTGDSQFKFEQRSCLDPTHKNIVAITKPGDTLPLQQTMAVNHGLQIGHYLTGMRPFSQTVDYRNSGM